MAVPERLTTTLIQNKLWRHRNGWVLYSPSWRLSYKAVANLGGLNYWQMLLCVRANYILSGKSAYYQDVSNNQLDCETFGVFLWHRLLMYFWAMSQFGRAVSQQHIGYAPNIPKGHSTHWGRDNMAAILQTTCLDALSWMKILEIRFKFHWNLFPVVQLTIYLYWFRERLGGEQTTRHYQNQRWYSLPTYICVTRPRWVNTICKLH